MAKKKSKSKSKSRQRDLYIKYFDPAIFEKLVSVKDLTYEEILVLEEELKNNLFFSTNSEMMGYFYKEKAFIEFKMNHPEIEQADMYPEFAKVYKKKKNDKK